MSPARPKPVTVELDATGAELARQYASASRTIRMWTEFRAEVKDRLVKILGDADAANYCGHVAVSVVRTRPRRFKIAAFATDHPDLYEQYREEPAEDEVRLVVGRLPGAESPDD